VAAHQETVVRPLSREEARRFLSRHLRGEGVEVGPGHSPFPLPAGARARYVDRWQPDENLARFPELGGTTFPAPDVAVNFDRERLSPLANQSADFVICSHVIEHLAEPIGFLADIHRVLRPGGLLILLVPDRRRTFDSGRKATPLAHLVEEHAAGVTDVNDEHVLDFLMNAGDGASYLGVPEDAAERARWFAWHRERSIHVHCWSEHEFPAVIEHTARALGLAWELVDAIATDAEGAAGEEFGYVLRRALRPLPPAECADRLLAAWTAWQESARPLFTRPPAAVQSGATLVLDTPAAGATVATAFVIGGWAVDAGRGKEPGIDLIEVWAIGADGSESFLGVAATGGHRPDVAAAIGKRGATAGYNLSAMGLHPGPYELRIAARSAALQKFVAVSTTSITVNS
jgi:SAM-dependent methyltransferase